MALNLLRFYSCANCTEIAIRISYKTAARAKCMSSTAACELHVFGIIVFGSRCFCTCSVRYIWIKWSNLMKFYVLFGRVIVIPIDSSCSVMPKSIDKKSLVFEWTISWMKSSNRQSRIFYFFFFFSNDNRTRSYDIFVEYLKKNRLKYRISSWALFIYSVKLESITDNGFKRHKMHVCMYLYSLILCSIWESVCCSTLSARTDYYFSLSWSYCLSFVVGTSRKWKNYISFLSGEIEIKKHIKFY